MATIYDVAAYILAKQSPVSHMKLHKLAYYSQAWSLVWDDAALFGEKIEAWVNGPVIPPLYFSFQGQYSITPEQITQGKAENLTASQRQTVDMVLKFYGDKSAQWLSDLTHAEDPWRLARAGLPVGERSNNEITLASMAEYYSGL